ncbi:glycoprotein 3-alpha-L-fucosyltransferase A-like [Drosophila persimilis]|uniref:glycoprotein 3-alpha-L-fucosyltransferase A-like n=1 Tax=Drosophila persimilis TaxID=7234 RepID=UPI000F08B196|nr:glycoprotein 3-alpha-L-fucosyltransferase A-like [Drosophila persimilis]
MAPRNLSLKLCTCFTLICALLLIYRLNLEVYEVWQTLSTRTYVEIPQHLERKVQEFVDHHEQEKPKVEEKIDKEEKLEKEEKIDDEPSSGLPWFFKKGKYYPPPSRAYNNHSLQNQRDAPKLLPHQDPHKDRIVNQLMYVPHDYAKIKASGRLKTILLYNGRRTWNVKKGRDLFLKDKCPVDTCEVTDDMGLAHTADMILYKNLYVPTKKLSSAREIRAKNTKQIKMLYFLESPVYTQNTKVPTGINWTATYRRDSTIVTPYSKWVYFDAKVQQKKQDRNYAANRTKKVAWFVSNCNTENGRLKYALELQKYIEVDIYGFCGKLKCDRFNPEKCFKLLENNYKFYLAFENSNCRDYITEKYHQNALNRGVLPIVMGARPGDYKELAPLNSYIHVDDFASPKELADYLKVLDDDDDLYNSFFQWKGTGEFINTHFWCRVCAMLHNEEQLREPHFYSDYNHWWRGPGVCSPVSWRSKTLFEFN